MTDGGGVGGVRPDERTLKQRTSASEMTYIVSSGALNSTHSLAGQAFFPGFTGVSHFACDIRWAAGAEKLTV